MNQLLPPRQPNRPLLVLGIVLFAAMLLFLAYQALMSGPASLLLRAFPGPSPVVSRPAKGNRSTGSDPGTRTQAPTPSRHLSWAVAGGESSCQRKPFDRLRRMDANGDHAFTPLDALSVINRLNDSGPDTIELGDLVGSIVEDLTPQQQASIERLFQNLNSIRVNSDISGDQIIAFVNNLSGIVDDATTPTRDQIDTLKASFLDEIADGQLSGADIDQLQSEVQALLVTLDVDPVKLEELLGQWQVIFDARLRDGRRCGAVTRQRRVARQRVRSRRIESAVRQRTPRTGRRLDRHVQRRPAARLPGFADAHG